MDSIKNVLPSVIKNLQSPEISKRSRLSREWPEIVGPVLEKHTQPRVGNQKELIIWVDQSSLAYEIHQKYSQTILKRAQAAIGEEEVTRVVIRVGQLR
ncbi:MAG: DUF721 domain-containing protein [Candidatus Omnitrophica bacterium]|nr:DUF721 domain-containing protein [Candidatus Omnitrophota bacterium]